MGTTSPTLRAADRRVEWDAAVERVLQDPAGVETVFQPIVDLRRGTVVGYEALARSAPPLNLPRLRLSFRFDGAGWRS